MSSQPLVIGQLNGLQCHLTCNMCNMAYYERPRVITFSWHLGWSLKRGFADFAMNKEVMMMMKHTWIWSRRVKFIISLWSKEWFVENILCLIFNEIIITFKSIVSNQLNFYSNKSNKNIIEITIPRKFLNLSTIDTCINRVCNHIVFYKLWSTWQYWWCFDTLKVTGSYFSRR